MATKALTREGAGVLSTVSRHLSFLDSPLVAKAVARSTFRLAEVRKPGTSLFMQIGLDQLEAQKGLLRCWTSTLVQDVCVAGNEKDGEVLCLFDEASALESLPALQQALVRGRSGGVRLLLAYQSDSQVTAAFKDQPTLLYDNCTAQIYLGASGYESAERLSKSCGEWTQVVEDYGENESRSCQNGGVDKGQGQQVSRGSSQGYKEGGRALLRPEEILSMSDDNLIALVRGMSPILARRVKWYEDPDFNPAAPKRPKRLSLWWVLLAAAVGLIVWALKDS